MHYNMPFADLYMDVKEACRRKGYASYILQEVKKACYLAGRVPAACCNIGTIASRAALIKAGLKACGFMLIKRRYQKFKPMNRKLILFYILFSFSSVFSQTTGETVVAGALVYNYKGLEAGADGDLETARTNFERALNYMPYFARTLVNVQICKDVEARIVTRRHAVLLFSCMNNWGSADAVESLKLINVVLRKNPTYTPAYLLRAQIYRKLKRFEDAETDYYKALKLSPEFALTNYFRGKLFSSLQKYNQAISDFTRTIEKDATYAPAFLERGIVLTLINKHDRAIQDFEIALKAWPKWAATFTIFGAYLNRGMQNIEKKRYYAALSDLNRAIELNPKFAESYLNRGIAFQNLREFDKAILDYNYAIHLEPEYAAAYYNRGHLFQTRKKSDLSIADYLSTVEIEPDHKQAHYRLGELYIKLKQFEKCIPHFAKVIELNPGNYWAYYWQALALEKTKNYRDAINSYIAFLEKVPAEHKNHKVFAQERIKKLTKVAAK